MKNTKAFVKQVKKIKLKKGECITSYDVEALFTSRPVDTSINIIKSKLEEDVELHNRTSMSIPNIFALLWYCLKNTYFLLQGKCYDQAQEAAMGSSIGPIVA